jgi:hypothetical protein
MFVGAIINQFATDVAFGGRGEPDILCNFESHDWAIECKSISGKPETTLKRIKEGMRQIQESSVSFGVVLVHIVNVYPHEKTYAIDRERSVVTSIGSEKNLVATTHALMIDSTKRERDLVLSEIDSLCDKYPKCRGIIFYTHTPTYFKSRRTIVPLVLLQQVWRIFGPELYFIRKFMNHLNAL